MPGWALKREIFPQENGPLGWGLPAPVVGVSVFGLAAVERPNQIELLGFDIRQAIKAGAARSDFFAGVGVGLNARLAIKALVIGRDFFAKAGVVLLPSLAHEPHVFGGLFVAVLSPCSVQNQGRSQKYPTPFIDHFSAHPKNLDGLYFNRQPAGEMNIFMPLMSVCMKKI
jgi:hypothetical protein